MDKLKTYKQFENVTAEKMFVIDKDKFQLFLDDNLVAESHFNIEQSDELFNKKYVGLFKLKTNKEFRGKGFMKYLLGQIFDYVKNELNINNILLNVYKNNENALNLYLNSGFEVYKDFDDDEEPYFTLIKKLNVINESVRDLMKPKSEEDIKNIFKDLSDEDKNKYMLNFIGREDLNMMLIMTNNGLKVTPEMIRLASKHHKLSAKSLLEYIRDKQKEREKVRINMSFPTDMKLNTDYMFESVRDLMKPKTDEEIRKNLKYTTSLKKLEMGIRYNKPWLVKQALDSGIVLNYFDDCLKQAVIYSDVEIVKMLLDYGLKSRGRYFDLMEIARKNGNQEMIKLLTDYRMKE